MLAHKSKDKYVNIVPHNPIINIAILECLNVTDFLYIHYLIINLESQECHTSRPVPVVAFHGNTDRLLPYDGSILLPMRECAASCAAANSCDMSQSSRFNDRSITPVHAGAASDR